MTDISPPAGCVKIAFNALHSGPEVFFVCAYPVLSVDIVFHIPVSDEKIIPESIWM